MKLSINSKDKILIVAPHPDDESIGCGGLLALYGNQCDLMLLTDGRKGHVETVQDEKKIVEIRKREFINASKIAGVNNLVFLGIEDGTVRYNKKIVETQDIRKYDYVFLPNRYESHIDHSVVLGIFKKMKFLQHAHCKIFEYEVWTPLRHATCFLDISSVADIKRNMIQQYTSQLKDVKYDEKGMALSCYRGIFNNTKYSEAFLYSNFSGIKSKVYHLLPEKMKEIVRGIVTK